jgi:protein gp88
MNIRKVKVPGTNVTLLTQTSKMPGPSWSLPAHRACPSANGTICDSCYASKGCYQYNTTKNAQNARFAWTVVSMRSTEGREAWIAYMVATIRSSRCKYFRVHDSGDMFNLAYVHSWVEVCRRMPEVKFWIPTRAWQQPSGALPIFDPILAALCVLASLPNVVVRPSALNFGDHAPVVSGLHAGSTAAMPDVFRARQCPAYAQDGHCGDCRGCWEEKSTPISYCKH